MEIQVLGHSDREGVQREAKILNRVIRAPPQGWEYECDRRHVQIIPEQLELTEAKPLSIPGVEETMESSTGCRKKESKSPSLGAEQASLSQGNHGTS